MGLFKKKKVATKETMKAIQKGAENMLACRLTAIDLRKEKKNEVAMLYDDIADSISGLLKIISKDIDGIATDVRVEE